MLLWDLLGKFPGTDYESFNYNWVIGKLKELKDSVAAALASEQAAAESAEEAHSSFVTATVQATRAERSATNAANSATAAAASVRSIIDVVDQVNTNTGRIDNLIATAGDGTVPSELTDIRVGWTGYTYPVAGDAVRGQTFDNNTDIRKLAAWLGTDVINFVDMRGFHTSYPSNWSIEANRNNLTLHHLTPYTTGEPEMDLYLEPGNYKFKGTFNTTGTTAQIGLYRKGLNDQNYSYYKIIVDNTDFTIDSGYSYKLVYSPSPQGDYTITNVRIYSTDESEVLIKPWIGKKWACIGDSLTAVNNTSTKRYYEYVQDVTGINVVNLAASGSGYARVPAQGETFMEQASNCPTDADVITIFGSWNDLGAGKPIGEITDTGTNTIAGCINTTLNNLQNRITLANIGIVAPTPWDTTQPGPGANTQAQNYFDVLKGIAEHRSIPFLDLWHNSGLRPWDADFRSAAYSRDNGSGTHPDENGHKLMAPKFQWFLQSLLLS